MPLDKFETKLEKILDISQKQSLSLQRLEDKSESIETQTIKTNGRVNGHDVSLRSLGIAVSVLNQEKTIRDENTKDTKNRIRNLLWPIGVAIGLAILKVAGIINIGFDPF